MNREVRKLAWFVWRHYPPAKDWGRKLLTGWIEWHYERAFCATVKDRSGRIIAFGMARPVMNAEDGYQSNVYDHEGRGIFGDFIVAPNRRILQGLFALMLKRFGEREFFAYIRPDNRLRVFPLNRFYRHILRKRNAYAK